MKFRVEKDSLGEVKVPEEAYFGAFTARAFSNFQISGLRAPREFIFSLGLIKHAATQANKDLGLLDKQKAKVIIKAAEELTEGKFDNEFILDVFQAGAGTPFNMNANEIIANRANELLGGRKGTYEYVHPNDHVNLGQSSNDVIPTATRITSLLFFTELANELLKLIKAFKEKAKPYKNLIKVGRTHLMDAVPMTVAQEFEAFSHMLAKTLKNLQKLSENLLELGIGATAIGTGINTHPAFQNKIVKILSQLSGLKFKPGEDLIEMTANMAAFSLFSSGLRQLAIDLVKIAQDLKLLNMGPKAGIAEITLPEVEPGSSIMPGKINPSIAEAIQMAAYQVIGNDHAISLCVQGGQLQLNVLTPAILFNLAFSLKLLTNALKIFREKCVEGIVVDEDRIKKLFEESLCTATALSPYLGYQKTAELVEEALKQNKTIKNIALGKKLLSESDLERLLSPDRTAKPSILDSGLLKKLRN